ncbi:MAG: hypothetical protein FIA95_15070 [Gemmatimonadetes bacterium]|nr:hypothetical protein [Gemmatimonadota bacterium]
MSESGNRIRVILRWIQIKDNKEAAWDDEGEFRFRSRVTSGGRTTEFRFPEQGFWSISDHPRRNKVDKIDKVLFEGEPGDSLVVELFGEELDQFSASDHLEDYRREFLGEPASWIGRRQPDDEGMGDPENMSDWRICYDIEWA